MNKILAAMLKTGEAIAVASIPGAGMVDAAVHGIVEHKGSADGNVLDAAEGAIRAVEAFKGADIVDEVGFRAGCATIEAGFQLVRKSLKVTPDVPTSAPA